MYYTPKVNRKDTQTTQYSSIHSNYNKKSTLRTKTDSFNSTTQPQIKTRQEIQKMTLQIRVSKKKVISPENKKNDSPIRVNPAKYNINVISKMSSQQHGSIVAYGISTFKGCNNVLNPHFLSVNLGQVKNILLAESFEGHTAAKLIRQKYPLQLIQLSTQLQSLKPEQVIEQAFIKMQSQIMAKQLELGDNSGTSFISVVIKNNIVMVANAGASQAICMTKNGLLIKLSNIHTTLNQKQMQRIIRNGGTVYQTVVNVPYQQDLSVKGPIRLSPSGLIYTRCLGRTMDYAQIAQKQNKKLYNLYNPEQQPDNLTWKPQIKYIKASDIIWLGIFSQAIINNCSYQYITSCVSKQMNRKSEVYSEHHIAKQISNKIVSEVIKKGVADALSAIILFLSPLQFNQTNKNVYETRKELKINSLVKQKVLKRGGTANSSLTYLGNRKSFIKQVDPDSKKYSLTKIQKINENQKQLKRQFSFNKNN